MNYKIFLVFLSFLLFSCQQQNSKKIFYSDKFVNYSNKGFTLIYDEKHFKNKKINNKLDNRSLLIFNSYLSYDTPVRITNLINGKYLIAKVGKDSRFPSFYNSVISKRIAKDLEISIDEPYVELKTLNQNNSFIINKAKTFDEEKEVATKAPVEGIEIKVIGNVNNTKQTKSIIKSKYSFNYIIKIADLYFLESAKVLKYRLINEYNMENIKIKKMSKNSYRIYKGPFINLDSIKKAYNDIMRLNFENIEIIKL